MAEGKPLAMRMMAAMAQQDCRRCGYDCAGYANALVPPGRGTADAVRHGRQGDGARPQRARRRDRLERRRAGGRRAVGRAGAGIGSRALARKLRSEAKFLSRRRLNGADSSKTTWHIEFDISAGGLDYVVGDSFGVFPKNHPELVDQVIAALGADRRPRRRRQDLVRGADRLTFRLAPRRTISSSSFLSGRRRAARQGACAGERRRPGRRRGDARRAGGSRASSRAHGPTLRRSWRRSTARATALFDLVVAEGESRPSGADRRHGSLSRRLARPPRRRFDLSRRARRARRSREGLCAEGACLPAAGQSRCAGRDDRPRRGRCAVPRLSPGAPGDRRARAQLAVLRSPASPLRLLL